jgi:phosphoenolpyruvate carboxylase
MVEDFETLALVYRALDLKTRDLAELGAVQSRPTIQLIPLVEDAERQLRIAHFVKILFRVAATSGRVLENMRIFLGISDSAVRHGHAASALALAYALQQVDAVNEEGEYKVWPVVGMGSPPFRGGLNNPHLVQAEALQYSGYRTATIQSAVRYDVSYAEFLRVREILSARLPPRRVEIGEEWVKAASRMYRDAVASYLQKIAEISAAIPSIRESELEAVWKGRGRRSTSAEGHSVYRRVVLRGPAPDASRCPLHNVGLQNRSARCRVESLAGACRRVEIRQLILLQREG